MAFTPPTPTRPSARQLHRRDYRQAPVLVTMDMQWLRHFEDPRFKLYQYVPLHLIVETIVSIPVYQDWDEPFWEMFYQRVDDTVIDTRFMTLAELTIDTLSVEIYDHMERMLPGLSGEYLFHRWLDRYSMVLIRSDLRPPSASDGLVTPPRRSV